jgi:hypothetical protein
MVALLIGARSSIAELALFLPEAHTCVVAVVSFETTIHAEGKNARRQTASLQLKSPDPLRFARRASRE